MGNNSKASFGKALLRVQEYLAVSFNTIEKMAHRYILLPFLGYCPK